MRQSFQQMMLDIYMPKKKKNLDTDIIPATKINSKYINDLNAKNQNYKTPKMTI